MKALGHPSVVELRRYRLHPGARETLITLFERELVHTQQAVGIMVLGWFRDIEDPDAFVWLRGFADMAARARALEAFYRGPVWQEHRDAANATMVDSDDVLLLRPAGGLLLRPSAVPATGLLQAVTYHLREPAERGFFDAFRREIEPALRADGATLAGVLLTEGAPNNWPALPVREDESVLVALRIFGDAARVRRRLAPAALGTDAASFLSREPEVALLAPTQPQVR